MINSSKEKLYELQLLSISEAAAVMKIGKETIGELIEEGKIGVISIRNRRKIAVKELFRFIEESTTYVNTDGNLLTCNKTNLSSELRDEFDSTKIFERIKEEVM